MVKLFMRVGKTTGRYLVLATLTATLAACGGSSGDTDGDIDGDGTPDSEDFDNDNDGLDDTALVDGVRVDPFVDLDGDGLDDASGLTLAEATDAAAPDFITPGDGAVCGSEGGSDPASETPLWNDNCWVRIEDVGASGNREGQFARSLYAVAVQRVLFCKEFGGDDGQTYDQFADGIFGRISETAMVALQNSEPNPILGDGEVGGNGWGKLQDQIELLAPGIADPNAASADVQDTYGFSEGPCAGIPMFYQNMVFTPPSGPYVESGWRLARNTPNEAQTVPFSIDPVSGL